MDLAQTIIQKALENPPKSEAAFNNLKRLAVAELSSKEAFPSKTELLKTYRTMVKNAHIKPNEYLERILTRRAVRSLSGVAIVTSLIKPYPCPGKCVYCPLDERMPKSYLSEEPAAMRALTLEFDPYEQMARRLEALENNGHPTDKIEFIVKGGTWNSYPLQYQYWFILRSFQACNELNVSLREATQERRSNPISSRKSSEPRGDYFVVPPRNDRKAILTEHSPLPELRAALLYEQTINETAAHRIIGLTLETRPDCINDHTIWIMRELGATRLEIGLQHTDDDVLTLIKRGHTNQEAKDALELLRNYGFKADLHLMPQLPGSPPDKDLAMIKTVFDDPGFRPDMIKIYPCSVVKNSELYDWFQAGNYRAYPTVELIRVLKEAQRHLPRYTRVSRLIRDIPGQYIEEGNKVTNLRQVIEDEMKRDGIRCQCLRCREVGHVDPHSIADPTPVLFIDEYATQGGTEYFLSFEDKDRQAVFAFCRLRVLDENPLHPAKKVFYRAFIRELHTYGQLLELGERNAEHIQHRGLGKQLVAKAEGIAQSKNVDKLAVISGVGVRDYYRKWGYELENTYMVKNLI